ncbi:MAG: hypothetical protein IKO32_12130, partial [Lachnospiraceae bacterium]|nr:hypothetical protein [Lachnospiraceae bacterium]
MNKKRVSLFKRICASALLVLMILPFMFMTVTAGNIGTPFPYQELEKEFPGGYYFVNRGFAGLSDERHNREHEGHRAELMYTNGGDISYNKLPWTSDKWDSGENIRYADQHYTIEVYKVPGLFETHETQKTTYKSAYHTWNVYIDLVTISDMWREKKTFDDFVNDKRAYLQREIRDDYPGTVTESTYNGGTLLALETTHTSYSSTYQEERTGIYRKYFYFRPVPELPEYWLFYEFEISDADGDDPSVFTNAENYMYQAFNAQCDVIWLDDFWKISDQTPTQVTVTQEAEETPGEDGGTMVPTAIVVGVFGVSAALAGAALAAGRQDDPPIPLKSYKMYVQKDFGDILPRGGEPQIIRARMAEVDESKTERDRNDLTKKIGATANGMIIHSVAMVGRYCEASVSIPKDYASDTASISFVFEGEGGTFTNEVIFKVDAP